MPDLYDLTIEHFDAVLGQNDCDFWEDITIETAQGKIAWHAANTKLVSVELERVGEGEPGVPSELLSSFETETGSAFLFSKGSPAKVERTGPMPTPKEDGPKFTRFDGYMTVAEADGLTMKVTLTSAGPEFSEVTRPDPKPPKP